MPSAKFENAEINEIVIINSRRPYRIGLPKIKHLFRLVMESGLNRNMVIMAKTAPQFSN